MPVGVVKTDRDEHLWDKAKAQARKKFSEGSTRFYKYTMGIYKQMKGEKAMKPILLKSRVKAHTRRTKGRPVNVRAYESSHRPAKEVWQMTATEREAEKLRLKTKYREALATPLASEGAVSPYQIGRMGKNARRKWERNTMLRMTTESRLRRLDNPEEEQKIRSRESRREAEGRILVAVNRINDLTRLGVGKSGKISPKYQRAIDKTRENLKTLVAPYPDLQKKHARLINDAQKSQETEPMETLTKYPLLAKAIGSVKTHQRRMKSGKVITVQEHQRAKKIGQRGYVSSHLRDSTNYYVDMAEHHKARRDYHLDRMKRHKPGSAKHGHHEWRATVHVGNWEMHRDEAGLSTKEERQKNPKKAEAKDAALYAAAGHKDRKSSKQISYGKSQESKPMETIDLTKFPALAKAIQRGNLSKSLEFVKTGKDVYLGVMAKLGQLQGELLVAVADWKAGIEPSTSATDDKVVETSELEKPAKEPWEIRSCRKTIERLQRIARNIDQNKKFKLSEYDLDEYGL